MLNLSKIQLILIAIVIGFFAVVITHEVSKNTKEVNADQTSKIQDVTMVKTAVKLKPANNEQVRCLATGIYYEAGYEPFIGKVAVARVIVNRVTHGFGSTPCKVVYQSTAVADENTEQTGIQRIICQFSWACDETLKSGMNRAKFNEAEDIARAVLTENAWSDIIPNNVLYFHSATVNPHWKLPRYIQIGNHVFYAQGREKRKVVATQSK
jgi:spore germination cell wall hydrolase CwlJ-like protein